MILYRLRLLKSLKRLALTRSYSKPGQRYNVTVIGAAGGIGQPLSLLLKQNPFINNLKLYDITKNLPGVALDLSHLNTGVKVKGYSKDKLNKALTGADIVVIPAGVPRKPKMTRQDLFKSNAILAYNLGSAIADTCPCALIAVITNPVNSTVPILAEAMYKKKKFDPRKIFGVTTLDLVRAETFVAEINGCDPANQRVPVIGGHSGETIIPLLSQAQPPIKISDEERKKLTERIQNAGSEVVQAKAGTGSATLSMAYAGARFTNSLLRALAGQTVVEYAYVRSNVTPVHYFSSPLIIGRYGINHIISYGCLDNLEKHYFDKALPQIRQNICLGMMYANSKALHRSIMRLNSQPT